MCDCIKEAEKSIKDEMNAADVWWEHSRHQGSQVRIIPYRKDGERSKASRYTTVNWRYCPLCGEEIAN